MKMKLLTIVASCLLLATVVFVNGHSTLSNPQDGFETRCGWFDNPTPANIALFDRDAEWLIGVQGGHQVEGDWDWPKFKPGQWVKTNNNYGYGCACLRLRVNREENEVLEIKSASARTLAACRQDPALKKWKNQFK